MNGFYAGYFAGGAGNGLAMFVIADGKISGADMAGVSFDGAFGEDEEGKLTGTVSVQVPPGVTVVQGVTAPAQGLTYEVPFAFPMKFDKEPFLELRTPLGNVNVRLQKVRELP
ncbi:hypothetical protein ACC696_06645 [Rhizobium ruizarguesonis]